MRKFVHLLLIVGITLSAQIAASELVDPTRPKSFSSGSVGPNSDIPNSNVLKLSAVFIKSTGKYAVINGETVAEGQSWNGYELTRVHAGGIVLKNQDGEKVVQVNNFSIKKDASNDF